MFLAFISQFLGKLSPLALPIPGVAFSSLPAAGSQTEERLVFVRARTFHMLTWPCGPAQCVKGLESVCDGPASPWWCSWGQIWSRVYLVSGSWCGLLPQAPEVTWPLISPPSHHPWGPEREADGLGCFSPCNLAASYHCWPPASALINGFLSASDCQDPMVTCFVSLGLPPRDWSPAPRQWPWSLADVSHPSHWIPVP